jgi:hypothetical protein
MALRQRKAKDPVLPLHVVHDDNDDGGKGSRSASLMPYSPSPRKRTNDQLPVYRVYIPIIGFFVVAFGFAYLTIGGSFAQQKSHHHHHPKEILPHRHYHDHTAGKMKDDASAEKAQKWITKEPKVKPSQPVNTAEPSKLMAQQMEAAKKKTGEKQKKVKIRCPDGGEGYLNDDYCDCEDGSDESLTSACSHLTVQSSTFHCLDGTGQIYASRVRDGIKDCLDGSDEII